MKKIDNSGFTLIEVIISLGVLSVGILALFSMQTMGIKGNSTAYRVTEASTWAADRVEEIVSLDYKDLVDRNGNGTKKDVDQNGVDGSGNNFGLDDTVTGAVVDADGDSAVTDPSNPGGPPKYTVYWNVAVDHPLRGVKTIQVNVVNTATNKTVSLQYQKFDQI